LIRWSIETSVFEDKTIEAGNRYSYRIVTMDKSHNTSMSPARHIYYEPGYRSSLKDAQAKVNRTLKSVEITWSLPKEPVFSFQIYKSVNNEPLSLLKTIENGTITSFQDKDLRLGNTYHYAVKYVLKSGIHGLPTEVLRVVY
jgi:fibronectin type 3 domain-containing protein